MLYEKKYFSNLGEPLRISPITKCAIRFLKCECLPKGLFFIQDEGIIFGISEQEIITTITVKYINKKNSLEKICMEKIQICVNNPITYCLKEMENNKDSNIYSHGLNNVSTNYVNLYGVYNKYNNIDDNIKKSINDLSVSQSMKYMHVNGANTFVYKI
jgi:hypothetical protein